MKSVDGSNTVTTSVIVAATTAVATSIITTLVISYIEKRRWRTKCHNYKKVVSKAKLQSTQLQPMAEGKSYNWMERHLQNCWNAAHELTNEYNRPERNAKDREVILETLLGSCQAINIVPPFHVDYGFNIHIGRNFFANFNCTITDCAQVKIRDNVQLGPNVQILAATHPIDAIERRKTEFAQPSITIGDDVWIGGGAVILPGVTIGNRVVVAAGAVVSKNVEDDVVVAGVPAKVVKRLKMRDK